MCRVEKAQRGRGAGGGGRKGAFGWPTHVPQVPKNVDIEKMICCLPTVMYVRAESRSVEPEAGRSPGLSIKYGTAFVHVLPEPEWPGRGLVLSAEIPM